MTAKKSGRKSGSATTFAPGDDTRRGKGPKKGAENAGRPASEVKAALLAGVSDALPELLRLSIGARSEGDRIRAIDVLCKYAGLASLEIDMVRPTEMVFRTIP
jgi:hypothetical protein